MSASVLLAKLAGDFQPFDPGAVLVLDDRVRRRASLGFERFGEGARVGDDPDLGLLRSGSNQPRQGPDQVGMQACFGLVEGDEAGSR